MVRSGLFVLLLSTLLAGCAYGPLEADEAYRDDVATVAVAAAVNAAPRPEVSAAVSDALVREVEQRTPYRVADVERADTLLEVTIREVDVGTPLRSRNTGFPQVSSLDVIAEATWTDLRDGQTLLRLSGIRGESEHFPEYGEGVPVSERSAAEALAERIVDEMAARW
ncbi:MAG: LPS assembly lipoprotein LptE [Planctomycetota bacterium]